MPIIYLFFSPEHISAYAKYTLMIHKVWYPDIVHKYSWKGCTVKPSEPCEQNNAPAGTSTLHLYIKSMSKMSLCKILGCTAHFLLAEVILMPKSLFFSSNAIPWDWKIPVFTRWSGLLSALQYFNRFISLLCLCIIHLRIINFTRGSMKIYSVCSKTRLYVRKLYVLWRLSR